MDKKKLITAAVASVVALGLSGVSLAGDGQMEKCYGVVKAGKNDCGNANHACAGQAKKDGDANEWTYLPEGTCDKLVGGSTSAGGDDSTAAENE